jgi:hypothetical protein
MADSTLDPDSFTEGPDRSLGRGHNTGALGPSDLSDTGSDTKGPGLARDIGLGIEAGTTSDPDRSLAEGSDGPDLGDADLDSDSDSGGTGERKEAGRDSVRGSGADIGTDHIEQGVPGDQDVDAGR